MEQFKGLFVPILGPIKDETSIDKMEYLCSKAVETNLCGGIDCRYCLFRDQDPETVVLFEEWDKIRKKGE